MKGKELLKQGATDLIIITVDDEEINTRTIVKVDKDAVYCTKTIPGFMDKNNISIETKPYMINIRNIKEVKAS